jgi:hypothetical protein
MNQIDNDKLGALVGKMLGDLGGAFSVPTVRIGFRTGLFDCLYRHGPARITDLASRTGLAERYVREWAFAQAANGYVDFDAETVLAPGDTPHLGKMLDMIMLTLFGGAQERTEPEYRGLLDKAGFRLTQVVPTVSAVSIVRSIACLTSI